MGMNLSAEEYQMVWIGYEIDRNLITQKKGQSD